MIRLIILASLISYLGFAGSLIAKNRYLAEPGLYISDIARREYKDVVFAQVIERHNNLNSSSIKPGQVILTPRLDKLLVNEGFPKDLSSTAYKLLSAYDNVKKSQELMKGKSKQSPKARAKLTRSLSSMRSARKLLINKSKPTIPYVMIANVDKAIKGVDSFLRKKTPPTSKQFNWVYQEFSNAFVSGIGWARKTKKYYQDLPLAH